MSQFHSSLRAPTSRHIESVRFSGHTKTQAKALAWVCAVFHSPIYHAHLHLLSWNCFGSDMNQCTSQVNPGEIEIHLQSCDHNQWWRKPHGGGFTLASKTQDHGTMGDNAGRESRGDYISDSECCSVGGAGGARERWHGVELGRTNTDWQGLACGRGQMSCASDLLWGHQCVCSSGFKKNRFSDTKVEINCTLIANRLIWAS